MLKTAFVTGGTGFIGLNLVEQLTAQGWDVTALHRPTSNLEYLKRFPVKLAQGSITDKRSLERAIPNNTEVIFHLAGDTNAWSKRNDRQNAVNIDGARNMVEVAIEKNVRTFIHTSSTSAWGPVKGDVDETTPKKGADSRVNYERSKYLGEKEALKGMKQGMKVVILNPGGVAGPYDTNTWGRLFFALRDNQLPGVPPGEVSFNHVREVVKAHIAAVEKGGNGENYILAGEDSSFPYVFREVAQLMGITKIPGTTSAFVLKIFGHLGELAARFTNKEPEITPELARILTMKGVHFSSEKAVRELDYKIVPWQVAFKDCYEWLVDEGKL